MAIHEHITEFAGKPVVDWEPDHPIADPGGTIYRLSLSYDEVDAGERWTDKFAAFLDDPAAAEVIGIVIGPGEWLMGWGGRDEEEGSARIVEALVAARDRLASLRALFLGDIIMEESEISWIHQSNVGLIFDAYPALEHFCVRGSEDLRLGALRHSALKSLIVQSGGLPAEVVREVAAAELPALEHLELWLGDEGYGGNATIEDLRPILAGSRFPKLRHLGLRDSERADEIAQALAEAPILDRIRVLDLSLGTLGDEGAQALLGSPAIRRLEFLDIHHHYCSPAMIEQLEGLGIPVNTGDRQEPDEYDGEVSRYVAVSE